jgi:hypothetical protein
MPPDWVRMPTVVVEETVMKPVVVLITRQVVAVIGVNILITHQATNSLLLSFQPVSLVKWVG